MAGTLTKTLFAILLITQNITAQLICNEPYYKDFTTSILKNLDKTQIPHETLYDAVYPFADLEGFTGATLSDTSNGYHFMQAYSEIYNSRNSTLGFQHPSDLFSSINNISLNQDFYHQIGFIDYQYSTIRSDAVSLNLLYANSDQLFDVPNRTISPYLSKQTRIAAVVNAKSEKCLREGTHYFHFDSDYVVRNTGFQLSDITHLEIYFGNATVFNGTVTGLEDQNIPFSISNSNIDFTVKMLVTTSNGTFTYYFSLCSEISEFTTSCSGQDVFNVVGDAYNGGYSEGTYAALGRGTIYYANANCATRRITKPIIFVDGFDPFNGHDANYIYTNYLNKPFRVNNIDTFLGAELRANGYDVIIFDQIEDPNKNFNTAGGGYIEHNGMALAKFLNEFYNTHSTTIVDDYVIVGASMGGLITRYALTYAEHNNIPHHTRLFVAFDSPQNGAQIPIGLQNGLDKFTNDGLLKWSGKYNNALHQSNAAKQLLLHHSDMKSEIPASHPARAAFYQHLTELGNWPTQCRMVSIACGNGSGKVKSIVYQPNPDNAPPIIACAKNLDFGVKYRPIVFLPCFLDQCYKMRIESYISTNNTRCLSLDYSLNNAPLLNLFGAVPLPYLSKKTYSQPNIYGNLDIAPGARFGTDPFEALSATVKSIAYAVSGPLTLAKNDLKFGNFIPTTSAAAYTFPNGEVLNYNKDFTGVNLSKCAGTTPFDTVYLQQSDLGHVAIDEAIANSFRSGIYFPKPKSTCSGPCPDYVTLGSSQSPSLNSDIKASKSIIIEPNHFIPSGTIFTAQIGCGNQISLVKNINILPTFGQFGILNTCNFESNSTNNQVICPDQLFTIFRVFTQNYGNSPYVEFSLNNGASWSKATLGDNGFELVINANPGQLQVFKARPKNDPTNVITINMYHCN